jgi:hypothetical protein
MRTKLLLSLIASAGLVVVGCEETDTGGTGTSAGGTDGSASESQTGQDTNDTEADTDDGGSDTEDTTESGTSGDTTDTGIGFISDPDGGGVSIECSVWEQDCGEGEKCMPWANDGGNAWNATRCSPLSPSPGQPGDPCTVEGSGVSGVDDCDVAAMCWDVDPETNQGTCIAFCTGSEANPVCDDPSTACSIANEGTLILCLPRCDPLIQDCPDGQACYGIDQVFVCAPDASGEQGVFGDPCEYINACDAGLACVNAAGVPGCTGSQGCCSSFCDLEDPGAGAACPGASGGQDCVSWFEEGAAPPQYTGVGVCFIPM